MREMAMKMSSDEKANLTVEELMEEDLLLPDFGRLCRDLGIKCAAWEGRRVSEDEIIDDLQSNTNPLGPLVAALGFCAAREAIHQGGRRIIASKEEYVDVLSTVSALALKQCAAALVSHHNAHHNNGSEEGEAN